MMIPVWVLASVLYTIAVVLTILWSEKRAPSNPIGSGIAGLIGCLALALETLIYLIFWIVYLALKL